MRKSAWIVGSFLTMYLIATMLGFATYLLLNPFAMWVTVFTLMPIISAALIYGYLRKMKFSREATLPETVRLLIIWIALSFGLDAVTYIVAVPAISHTPANWTFFRDQSPWIWLSYAVLAVSAWVGGRTYLRKLKS